MPSPRVLLSSFLLFAPLACTIAPPVTPPPQASDAVDRLGDYTAGPTRAVLTGDHVVLFGTSAVALDPSFIGDRDGVDAIQGGLIVLDPDTGKTHRFGPAEGFPEVDVEGQGRSPISIQDLDWIARDVSFTAAARTHVLRGDIANGGVLWRSATLRRDGRDADAQVASVTVLGNAIYAGTDQGIAVLDPATLAAQRWIDTGARVWIRAAAAVDLGGPALLVAAGEEGTNEPTALLVIRAGAAASEQVALPEGAFPASVARGPAGKPLVGLHVAAGGEVHAVTPALGTTTLIDARALSAASAEAFVPSKLAYDPVRGVLAMGGAITIRGPVRTGGLAEATLDPTGTTAGKVAPLFDRRDPLTQLLPWQVEVLEIDGAGRWYTGGAKLCNEHRAGVVGVLRVERAVDGSPRLVRPFLSGVRAMTEGPDGVTWLGLRDEKPGLVCDGVSVAQEICRLLENGACEVWTPQVNDGSGVFAPAPGATAIAFGSAARKELALVTDRDAAFVRTGATASAWATQFDPGLNLEMTGASWAGPGAIWLASAYGWDDNPGFPDAESSKINARSPQGLGYIEWNAETGRRTLSRRYVRDPSDLPNLPRDEIGGLPSSDVRAVLSLGGRRALIGLGAERYSRAYDHLQPALAPTGKLGGLAIVDDRSIEPLAAPAGVAYSSVVALVRSGTRAYALDELRGVLAVDGETVRLVRAAPWSGKERALSLAIGANGEIAVGTTHAVYADRDGALAKADLGGDAGYVWSVRWAAKGVLDAGTDHGLRRVVFAGSERPTLGPKGGLARDPWPLEPGCNGEAGCECFSEDHCAPDLSCTCPSPSACTCEGRKLQ